jgi:(p)ppGpp synthase/HD superfamily hydrolase
VAQHPNQIHLSKRFFHAAEWAAARHAARTPGGGGPTPSLGQVLGIASLVLEDGGTEREAVAAMVLDALGDDDAPRGEIRDRFGKKVARLVRRCVDDRPDPEGRDDAAAWREHRQRSLDLLECNADESVLRVRAADTLREVRSLVSALRRHGSIAFARFPVPPGDQLAHYHALVLVLTPRLVRSHLLQELRSMLAKVERLAELDTAAVAWRVAHIDAA